MAKKLVLVPLVLTLLCANLSAQVIINEIHYNPVELPAFDTAGNPVFQGTSTAADFTDDVHEFLELRNPGATAIDLSGWRLDDGIQFTFPAGTTIPSGGFLVVAKNPARIQTVYGISGVLGPYTGLLGNKGDTVRVLTPANVLVDAVSYQPVFPWAISANRLGANADFTLQNTAAYQYKGRSLQRVSAVGASNDPANWVAVRPAGAGVTFADLPTPGAENIVSKPTPKPVVIGVSAVQATDSSPIIRSSSQVRVLATFSNPESVTNVQLEYFIDNINAWGEVRTLTAMAPTGTAQFVATIDPQANRSVVRYRILANVGDGPEVISPRADDPAIVPTGFNVREAWHAYYVTPARTSTKPVYDVHVSDSGQAISDTGDANVYPFTGLNGLQAIAYNATGVLKRITSSSTVTTAYPRELGWPGVTANSRIWNGTVPAVFVHNGVVRDAQIRFHGSRYNRRPSRKSYKLLFADYQLYQNADSVFITDKSDHFSTAHGLHQIAGLPVSGVRWVDWYLNSDPVQFRLEQGEYNGDLLDNFHEKMQRLNPGSPKEETGEYYKSVGVIVGSPTSGEGPYGSGNGWLLPATGGTPSWSELRRYEYTYGLQNHAWKGAKPIRDMLVGLWAARGDSYTSLNPNIANTRAWFLANWDVDTELTSLALGNWMTPWDDTTQNHFFWRRITGRNPNGTAISKWVRLLWDFDSMYGRGDNTGAGSSIYLGEAGLPSSFPGNNSRGPNYVKDSFIKAFRNEYKQRLWFLNNTLLDPENLQTLFYGTSSGGQNNYRAFIDSLDSSNPFTSARFASVNSQVGLGIFYKPTRPTAMSPTVGNAVLPGASFIATSYNYNAAFTHTAAPSVSPHSRSKWEIRSATDTYDNPVYVLSSTTNLTSLPIPFGQLTYGQSYFWRVTYFDADGHPSITSNEARFSYGPVSPAAGNVTINEVMADNAGIVMNGSDRPDYVELKNNTAAAVDLSGWNLTDDELQPTRFTFPAGTTIAPGGYLVVWCDNSTTEPGLHSGFGLSRRGQRVLLIASGIVRDAIAFGPQIPNGAIGRVADGTGAWTLVDASPGQANAARAFSTETSSLKFNEWMAVPASGSDWFEIYNAGAAPVSLANLWLSDTPGTPKITQIPALSFVAAGGCVRFDADDTASGFSSVAFRLGASGDNLLLSAADGVTLIHSVSFGPQQSGVSEGAFPDGATNITSFPVSASPGDNNWLPAQVRINEVLASSMAPVEDYVEIFNPSASAIDLSGWWISDDRNARLKYQIPAGSSIAPGGYLVFLESQFNVGASAFSLSSFGDEIVLTASNGGAPTGYRAQFEFDATAPNVSLGYLQTAQSPVLWRQIARTSTALNSGPAVGPIIINEVHYHPPDLSGLDNTRDEYIEIHNITTSGVDVSGWRLKGGVDFTFPAGSVIRPGDYVLLVNFAPSSDPATLNAFRAALGVAESAQVLGPYTPKLGNDSVSVEISYPGTVVGGVTPYINVDEVVYTDFAPWPLTADGNGSSLQKVSRNLIGNDAANWVGSVPTPGRVNSGQAEITDNDADGLPNAWEDAFGLDKFTAADAALDADSDGQSNGAEFTAGTNPRDNNDRLVAGIVRASGGPGFTISFPAKANRAYAIEYKAQLSDAVWQPLTTVPAQAAPTTIQYTDVTSEPQRLYRVRTAGE